MKLDNNILVTINGGAFKFTATMLNAMSRMGSLLFGIGQSIGSFVRSKMTKRYC